MFYEELYHYGTKRHSGRYPWGSGDNPYQHESWFLNEMTRLRAQGMSDTEIAREMGMSSNEFRTRRTVEKNAKIAADSTHALVLKDKGFSNVEIGDILGISEGTVRNYLNPAFKMRESKTQLLANELKAQVEKYPYLDVGKGVELQLGVSKTQMKPALALLKDQGYKVSYVQVEQATNPGKYTSVVVLTKDDVSYSDIYKNRDKIMSPQGVWFEDNGMTKRGIEPPVNIDSNRVAIRYSEDGGSLKDGVIEVRRGVEDISLGKNAYAQVRIAVDGTHYLKGMAMYSDDLPDGVDLLFNTNKGKEKTKMQVLKTMEEDPDNPFGSSFRQRHYIGKDGKEHLSAMNIVNEDSDWEKWSKTLSSQFLSKQHPALAKRQLDLVYKEKKQEYDDICSLTNPAVKQRLLQSFADDCDSQAVDLKAAPLPGQKTHVILPLTKIKDTEVYAPQYRTGEEVILVRHPHGGTFEIPRLIVNNRNQQGRETIGNQAQNAIGISAKVAEQLSGADFDGDTVLVIPTRNQPLKTSKPLKALEGFDPKIEYKEYPGMPKVGPKTGFHKQNEMGKISNLITDMTIKGATPSEIARAVKHSMVVIDAEKHNLDWRRSAQENDISQLKEKYQGGKNRGAATIISRASSEQRVPQRKDYYKINPDTGEKIFEYTGETWTDPKTGKEKPREDKSTKMYEADNAFKLTSGPGLSAGTTIEGVYATHANKLKALGNQARKELYSTGNIVYNPSARKTYSAEVDSLNAKLNNALKNAPNERKAQLAADVIFKTKKAENPELQDNKEEARKVKAQIIEYTRQRAGTSKRKDRDITITDREWEAIQAGALHHTKVQQILQNTNLDDIKERATPRDKKGMSSSSIARAKAMLRMGYPQSEVAKAVGVSVTTLKNNNVI